MTIKNNTKKLNQNLLENFQKRGLFSIIMNGKKIAITWFNKLNQQFAVSINKSDDSESKTSSKKQKGDVNFSFKMSQFNPFDQSQHFIIHSINPNNIFPDSFYIIESILYPNHFVEIAEETIVLRKKQKSPTKWQFIDGHFTCEKGKYYLFYDSNDTFPLKIINHKKFNDIHPNELAEFNSKLLFHLCFYDGNSIPENLPIVFYSPLFKKVMSSSFNSKIGLQMAKFNDHSKFQAWIFNSFEKSELCNSVDSNYFLTNDLSKNKISLSQFGTQKGQYCIGYRNYKLMFTQPFSYIQYDTNTQTFGIQNKDQGFIRTFKKYKKKNDANEKNGINHPSAFLIFLSNQKNLFEINHVWKHWYLYDFLSPRMNKTYFKFTRERNDVFVFEKDKQLFENASEIDFSNSSNKKMICKFFRTTLNYNSNGKYKHVDSRIFISNDPRILLSNVQLDDNSSITISLILDQQFVYDEYNNNYFKIGHNCLFEDCLDYCNNSDNNNNNNSQYSLSLDENSYVSASESSLCQDNDWRSKKIYISDELQNTILNSSESLVNLLLERKEEEELRDDELLIYINKKDIPSKISKKFARLLKGNHITISKENSNYCKKLGERMGITGLIDVANVIESFSVQYERLLNLSDIQRMLMTINPSNYKSLVNHLESEINNYDSQTICWLIISVSVCKPLENDSLARFCSIFLQKQNDVFKKEFKKTIQRSFISPEPNFFFLKKIHDYCEDLFSHDEIKKLLQLKRKDIPDIIFFYKEFPELIDENELKDLQKEQENFDEFIDTGLNSSTLMKIIRNDDIDSFQQIVINQKIDVNQETKNSSLERIPILKNNPSLIQYAAFFGAVKIFKYLFLNEAKLDKKDYSNRTCYHYAIAGGNSEIIHTIHQKMNKKKYSTDMIACAIKYGQDDVFQWIMSNIPSDNLKKVIMQDLILTSVISKNIDCLLNLVEYLYQVNSKCIHYSANFDNLEFLKLFLPFYIEDKETLICDAACSGNVDIMKYLMENGYKYNIQFDDYLRKLAIKIAIKFDNSEMFQFLSNEKDYSDKNFFYAGCCGSLSILQLFSEFDYSKILLNNVPFIISLITQKSNAIDVLMKSRYFNYKEKFNYHSIFYYAVTNKMFDLAAKLYSQYPNYYDVNENGLLVDNCTDPEIVGFLIGYNELHVNSKNSNNQTSIDILTHSSLLNGNVKKSISYLLRRPDIQINPNHIILNSIQIQDYNLFEIILNYCVENKIIISCFSNEVINEIISKNMYQFIIQLIKNKMITFDQDKLIQICVNSQNANIYHEILNDKIPKEKEMSALIQSMKSNNCEFANYLLDIIKSDFKWINDYIPEDSNTLLTFALNKFKNPTLIGNLLSKKKIDINKPNKFGETPFSVAIKSGQEMSVLHLFISNENIKVKFDDFKAAHESLKRICKEIIYNVIHFDDDPQLIIDYIIEKRDDYLIKSILIPPPIKFNKQKDKNKEEEEYYLNMEEEEEYNDSDDKKIALDYSNMSKDNWNYFERIKKTVFIPAIASYYLMNSNENILSVLHSIVDDLKNDKNVQEKIKYCLCKSLFNNIFNPNIIEYYKMFFVGKQKGDSNKLTLFGNVRTKEIAKDLVRMLYKEKVRTENIIREVGGLNIVGKTAFYTSIEEDNSSLFKYLLNLSKDLNAKLSKQKNKLTDFMIYAKNEDGNNPFYAACLKDKQDTFLNPIMDKMIQLNNSDYFGKYGPLRAAFTKDDLELADILISKGFNIDHYAFCQILQCKKYDIFKKKYLKDMNDFKFDLFMPLYLIQDENELRKIFANDMINYDFIPEGNRDEFDDYLVVSSIRNSNEKIIQLILNNCDKSKIMFHWQDIHGMTVLHYAIEKSMTNIIYLLIDEFTSTKSKIIVKSTINQNMHNSDLMYPENDVFCHFFIEDEEKQTPIHYLFKSLNIDYIMYFYKHASAFLKSTNKENIIYDIFNAQILSYEKIETFVEEKALPNLKYKKPTKKIRHRYRNIDDDFLRESSISYSYSSEYISEYSDVDIYYEEANRNVKSVFVNSEGQTLLTFSILNKNLKFIESILAKIPEIDPNRTNKDGVFPLLLAVQNDDLYIFEAIIESNKNAKNPIDINKSGIVFSLCENASNDTLNFCLKKLMKSKNFDFNQKKTVQQGKKSKEKIYLIDIILEKYSILDKEIIKMFFESPKLSLNIRSNIVFDLIDKSIGNIVSYSSLFARIDDDVMKNARTKDDAKDTIATYAAKHYKNYAPLIALIFDKRIDFIESKNAEGKSAVDILKENENLDLVTIILNKNQ